MPLLETKGAASAQGFGMTLQQTAANYIEDVFSTWLYTGNGSTQTITNGIDLAGKGGLVWLKGRSLGYSHGLFDTVRGANFWLNSASTDPSTSVSGIPANPWITGFNSNGFGLGSNGSANNNGTTYVSWTFREQPKFFDVVTTTSQTFSHLLASVPGCVIWKRTDASENWNVVSRRADGSYVQLNLNLTDGAFASYANAAAAGLTSTAVTLPSFSTGGTYVAYLFAHNAGGFGLTGTDNVISCGSFTTDGSGVATVNLGYEPQWVMWKASSTVGNWVMIDNMRGWSVNNSDDARLRANLSNAENMDTLGNPTATGFFVNGGDASATHIYIAIRRGPMRTPTNGTSVYNAIVRNGTQANATVTGVGFPVDLTYTSLRPAGTHNPVLSDRLRGAQRTLSSRGTQEEQTEPVALTSFAFMDGVSLGADNTGFWNGFNSQIGSSYVNWFFRRAPGFFDEVCYTGNGSTQTIAHNLGVVPELIIAKNRGQAGNNWPVLFNFASTTMNYGFLNLTNSCPNDTYANVGVFSAAPTSTNMFLTNSGSMNASGFGIVAYLFASCPGVSRVGSFTGTGSTQVINCGFTGGARFVLIKAISTIGNWLVWDSARGIVAGNDPYLELNTTNAEVTNTDWVDTAASGFELSNAGGNLANSNGVSYIFLAIA